MITIVAFLLSPAIFAQEVFVRTVQEYYRVDPFHGSFSAFIKSLTTDSALLKKEILKQTDSTGYLVKGEYKVFNPFSLNANKVEMIFYENSYNAQDRFLFNFYTYQLTAYFPDTELTRRTVKKEYAKLGRKLRRDLYRVKINNLKGYQDIEDGEITTYTNNDFPLVPAMLSWQTLSKTKQLGLTLVVRIRQYNNLAYPVNELNVAF
ncbi:hypothetical protein GCM10027516_26740 [Niabella aquatica]